MLDVPEHDRHRSEHDREAGHERSERHEQRQAAQKVVRVSGMKIRLSGRTIASITSIVTRFVATTETGSSWRGKRTCFTRLACPSRLEHDICTADWKKIHVTSPESTNSG